jgi:membrane-associated phospholipid phosphatase
VFARRRGRRPRPRRTSARSARYRRRLLSRRDHREDDAARLPGDPAGRRSPRVPFLRTDSPRTDPPRADPPRIEAAPARPPAAEPAPARPPGAEAPRTRPPGAEPARARALRAAALAVALVVAIRAWLELVGPLPGERWSLRFTQSPPRPQPWRDLIELFSILGTPIPAGALVGCAAWLVWRGLGRRAALFVVVACAGVGVNGLLKIASGVTPLWREAHGAGAQLNYPSGHVAFAVCFAGALAILAAERGRRDLVAMAMVPIVLMGPFRVLGGTHLPSDVLAGYLLAGAWLAATWALLRAGGRAGHGARP